MTEQHAQSGAGEPVPPSDAAPEAHADAPQAGEGVRAATAPLGEWCGPAFWMACGALLAGLLGGGAVLVQRVAVERDMMAVAATLPQSVSPTPGTVVAAPPAPAGAPAAPVSASPLALQPSASLSVGCAAPSAQRQLARRPKGAARGRIAHAPQSATIRSRSKMTPEARRKRELLEAQYAEVFKRCPRYGERGAIQCRRDICNGAEGKGLACKPYVRKLP